AQRLWSSTGSTDKPMTLVLRLSNSAFSFAIAPSSVVHTGVKSFGCENSTAHWSPIHLWKSIGPSVVCAWKLGASSPIRIAIGPPWGSEMLRPARHRRQAWFNLALLPGLLTQRHSPRRYFLRP